MRTKQSNAAFTGRELDILDLLAQGKSYVEISNELFLCLGTINVYIAKLKKKTGVTKQHQLVEYANNRAGHKEKTPDRLGQAKSLLKQAIAILNELT